MVGDNPLRGKDFQRMDNVRAERAIRRGINPYNLEEVAAFGGEYIPETLADYSKPVIDYELFGYHLRQHPELDPDDFSDPRGEKRAIMLNASILSFKVGDRLVLTDRATSIQIGRGFSPLYRAYIDWACRQTDE